MTEGPVDRDWVTRAQLAETEAELKRTIAEERATQRDVERLRRIERALKQHKEAIEQGRSADAAGKIALAGLGFADYQGLRPASEVLAKIVTSYTLTKKWPMYISWPNEGAALQIIAPGRDVSFATQDDYVEEMRRNPPMGPDGEVWHDNGDGTYVAKREDGSEAIMDTSGIDGASLERALSGDMTLAELRAQSPAAAMGIGHMIAHNKLVKASEDNPLSGQDVADLLEAARHLDPRIKTDKAVLDMVAQSHCELVHFDHNSGDDSYRMTTEGQRVSEALLREQYNLPGMPSEHVRAMTITADGNVRLVALGGDDDELLKRITEFLGGALAEAVYCWNPSKGALRNSGRPDSVIFVDEEGLLKSLPTNFKATELAGQCGAQYGDIGRGLVGNVMVLGMAPGGPDGDDNVYTPELPERYYQWSQANDGANAIAGIKEFSTSQLRTVSRNSAAERLDYVLDPRLDPLLDPAGIHILRALATIDQQAGVAVDPFIRCELTVKLRGIDPRRPVVQNHFDVRLRDYVALRTPPGGDPYNSMRGTLGTVTRASLTPDDRTPRT